MDKLKKLFVLVLIVGVLSLSLTGCKDKSEHPTGEHPASEHPSGEHPSAEDIKEAAEEAAEKTADEHPTGEHPR